MSEDSTEVAGGYISDWNESDWMMNANKNVKIFKYKKENTAYLARDNKCDWFNHRAVNFIRSRDFTF